MRCLDKQIETDSIWKLELKLVAGSPNPRIRFLDGLAIVERSYDPNALPAINQLSMRNREILNLLHEAAGQACEELSWPKKPFEIAYHRVLRNDFRNEWIWKKSKWSPDRRLRAELRCEHDASALRMHLQVRDREDHVTELKILEAPPDEFLFTRYFGEMSWITNADLRWTADDGEVLWEGRAVES